MNKKIKIFLLILFSIFSIFLLFRLYYRLTDDFRISNMTYPLPFEAPWIVPDLTVEEHSNLASILDQKFHYIGKGAQCYAFTSEDQKYVLKFFKFKHLKPNFLVDWLPSIPPFKEYKMNCIERKKRKLIGVFNGYDLAFKENREGSSLIYLHLLPTKNLNLHATVVDKIGLERTINLDDVVFLVQEKGETLRTRLNRELKAGQLEAAESSVSAILNMYLAEYQKGIFDHDHGIMHNTGFIENKPFHLDVGKLNKEEKMKEVAHFKKDLEHVVWKIDVWVKSNYPQYSKQFTKFLESQYLQFTGESLDLDAVDPKRFKKKKKGFF